MHHAAKENDQRFICIYCKKSLLKDKWESKFSGEIHYKTAKCECGKEARIKVDFHGSGHDSWEKESTIDDKVKIIG